MVTIANGSAHAPAFRVVSVLGPSYIHWIAQLSDHERASLARIGQSMSFRRGNTLYHRGDSYDHVFVIVSGVVKTFTLSRDGRSTIVAFLFAEDIAGLGEEGSYVNSAEAVSEGEAIRLPLRALETLLETEAHLDMLLLCKACNELRASQQHVMLLSNHSARTKVALFLHLVAQRQPASDGVIRLPMGRGDIAGYLGLSVEAVSRTFRGLEREGVLRLDGPRAVSIADASRFTEIAGEPA